MRDNQEVALILIDGIVSIRLEESRKTVRMVGCPVFGPKFELLISHTKQDSDRTAPRQRFSLATPTLPALLRGMHRYFTFTFHCMLLLVR